MLVQTKVRVGPVSSGAIADDTVVLVDTRNNLRESSSDGSPNYSKRPAVEQLVFTGNGKFSVTLRSITPGGVAADIGTYPSNANGELVLQDLPGARPPSGWPDRGGRLALRITLDTATLVTRDGYVGKLQ